MMAACAICASAACCLGTGVRGHALVTKTLLHATILIMCARNHKLAGESYVGRVLVLDAAKGGVATAWMLREMKARGVVPAALVLNAVNPIMVQGAAFA